MEAEEIKLAGVRADLGNINLTHLCKYTPCKLDGEDFKQLLSAVDLRFN